MNEQYLNTPWKIGNEIERWFCYPLARIVFALNRTQWKRGWHLYGVPIIQKHRCSKMEFGHHLQLRSTVRSNPLGPTHPVILSTRQPGAILMIGDHFGMTGGSICVDQKVVIGNHVAVGANTIIVDTDFHPLDPEIRKQKDGCTKTAPIYIEDDVFIGMNCLILKGVVIGKGSVVGAGSVVTRDVPSYSIIAGNPAKVIRSLR